ncbi:Transcriptional regulator, GntR family [uncultured Alphaproteobacteria bacterium]|uniref:Transcriptional regulator, GntR family n=1 Tax=uncultured Alphaproteobacteria bacterium TaxID=91750 RepID=A0A212JJJ0_9PROT|nr:Transcriptional regulator, GntR family [uncultured Alphaproteobacteria bacterium]
MKSAELPQDVRLPLYHRLRDEMLERITHGEWRPDQAIPTEAELARAYGVAVGTVRKAVEMLVAEGLLERNQGRGTFVRRPSFDNSLFRFFRLLSSGGQRVVPDGKVLARTLAAPPPPVAAALGLGRQAQAIRLDRLRLIAGAVVLVEEIWLPRAPFAGLLDVELGEFGNLLYPFYEARCGQAVASARETLTVDAADAATARALGIAEGRPVVVIERLALGYDRRPLEWRRSVGAADTFRYQVEIC